LTQSTTFFVKDIGMLQIASDVDSLLVISKDSGWWAEMLVPQDMSRSALAHGLTGGFAEPMHTGMIQECSQVVCWPDGDSIKNSIWMTFDQKNFWSFSDIGFVGTIGTINPKYVSPLLAVKQESSHMIVAILVFSNGNYCRHYVNGLRRHTGCLEYQRGRISVR
jgi:hypothetical protein